MNDHRDSFPADERDRLEQELLELHFGCHENPDAIEARLAAEPALRALQQKILQQASLLETAAKPELPQLELPAPKRAARRPFRLLRTAGGRLLTAGALAAAMMLGFFVVTEIAKSQWASFQRDHLHLTVSAPRAVPAGAPWSFTVEAVDLRGEATECRVRWQTFDKSGAKLAADEIATTGGRATVAMPADLRMAERVEVVAVGATDEVRQMLTLSQAAAGPLVHVSTDRPVYRPGETVFVRAVVLDRVTMLPLPEAQSPPLTARLLDSKGAAVAQEWQRLAAGATGFALVVPTGSPGGPHQVEVSAAQGSFPTETADLVVRSFQQPRLKKTIVLDRITYSPGAHGSALVRAERMGGEVAAGAAAVAKLVIDGSEVWSDRIILDDDGEARFRFTVPSAIEQGSARFVATITDGGTVETELKPFVVPTGKVLVAGFPEGGELIAGVPNGLYLECTDPLGRPVDTAGEVVDDRGDRIERFVTTHQGRVKLTFVPRAGRSYRVRLAQQTQLHDLPAVRETGIAMHFAGDQIAASSPLHVSVAGRGDGPWLLGVFCRGVLVGQTTLRADEEGELRAAAEVALPPHATGVLRATVFDRNLQPLAERLVQRAAEHRVEVELTARHPTLNPGDAQQVTVRTRDENGQAIPTLVGLTVTDLGAVSLGSEPRVGLFDHAQLFADVEKVDNLGDFFTGDEHGARNADLLLGTRGWRRFVWRNDDPAKTVIAAHGDWGKGLLAREGFSQTPQVASNLRAASAPGQALAADARRTERALGQAAGITAILLVLLLLVEGLAWLLRSPRVQPLFKLTGFAAATGLLVWSTVGTNILGGADAARPEAMRAAVDFAAADRMERFFTDIDPVTVTGSDGFAAFNLSAWAAFQRGAELDPVQDAEPMDAEEAIEDIVADAARPAEQFNGLVIVQPHSRVPQRQYAHRHQSQDGRSDFTATVAWFPWLMTDERGEATVSFATSDAVTTWLVQADAHATTGTGRVGQGSSRFTTRLPFSFDVKLPDEISAGDELLLPIAATAEGLTADQAALVVQASGGLRLVGTPPGTIPLTDGRGRALVRVTAAATAANASGTLTIEGGIGRFTDRIIREIKIAPRGFPHRRSHGGTIAAGTPATFTVAIPSDAVPFSGHVALKVFPSPLAGLMEGLQGLLQEPHGCFEQASSSNYPNTLVLTLLEATGDDVPVIAARARELLPRGYSKITGYECKERGYEWFGGNPGHEALSAYGLLQFSDMAKVYDVDAAMVDRTRTWLLSRRTGKGGYERNSRALDRFGAAPQPTTDAYVTYALLQAGVPASELQTEIDALVGRMATKDAYELALISCALHLAGRPEAVMARQRLAAMQDAKGWLRGEASITRSGGNDLIVETTGFAVLAWLVDPAFTANVRAAVEYLNGARGATGRFGTTQATIVALRALTAYATDNRGMRESGTLRIYEGLRLLAERTFTAGDNNAIVLELWNDLPPGEHSLRLEVEGGGTALPWACDVAYHSEQPADDPDGTVTIRTALRAATVIEGDTIALDITVQNRTGEGQPMALAIVGLPAGLELQTRVLEDLQKAGSFAFWELQGRELALYWRDLEPEATVAITLDLVARVPGASTGPASRSYLYYTPDSKRWAVPVAIEVTPR